MKEDCEIHNEIFENNLLAASARVDLDQSAHGLTFSEKSAIVCA